MTDTEHDPISKTRELCARTADALAQVHSLNQLQDNSSASESISQLRDLLNDLCITSASPQTSILVKSMSEFHKHGLLTSSFDDLFDDFCKVFSDVHVFPNPPNLAQWSSDGECFEIHWFSNYLIIIDPNDGKLLIEFRKYPGPKVKEFHSFEDFREFCLSHPEQFELK